MHHFWRRGDCLNGEMVMETIYICDASHSRDMAAMIARESGYLGDTLQIIDLEENGDK